VTRNTESALGKRNITQHQNMYLIPVRTGKVA